MKPISLLILSAKRYAMKEFDFNSPVCILTGEEFLPKPGINFAQQILDYFQSLGGIAHSPWGDVLLDMKGATGGKKQMTGMMAAPILIDTDSFICVVVVIYNLKEKRLYLHETFLTEKNPDIAASSLVHVSEAESPQSRGSIAKILSRFLKTK